METQQPLEPLIETQQPLEPLQASPETQEPQEPQEPLLPYLEDPKEEEGQWWWRLEPILGTFCTACQTYLILGTEVALDEIIVRFHRRSSDTYKMPNKPIKQGYKIFALVDNGYV